MPVDYSKRFRDYARFTPAISEMYTRFIDNKNPKRPMPGGLSQQDLDYLSANGALFYLPNSLYSAGQAAKSDGSAAKKDMVTERDRETTIILGDSGGFQIQTGAIKFKGDETRNRMMKWMERNCDWSMILDFPTGGINMGTIQPHYERLVGPADSGLPDSGNKAKLDALMAENNQSKEYNTCLLQTMINNDWFVANRTPGATNFLNVVQGRNNEESKIWYEKVKHYPFEGWSLAGPHKENFYMTMHRLIDMRDDGILQDRNWLHFLGVGKLEHGCVYTTIQRMVREHVNPNFTISYDVSSPFTTAAFGNLFLGYTLDNKAWTIQSAKCEDLAYNKGGQVERDDIILGDVPRGTRAGTNLMEIIKEAWDEKMEEEAASRQLVYDATLFDAKTASLAEEIKNKSRLIETQIAKRLTMEDVCYNVDVKYLFQKHRELIAEKYDLDSSKVSKLSDAQLLEATSAFVPSTSGDPEVLKAIKAGGKFTSSWDVVSYAMMMNHNVQVHLEAVFESQDLYDKGDPARVPANLLRMKEVIEEIFTCDNPHEVIEQNRNILNSIAGDAASGGVPVDVDIEKTGQQTYSAQKAAFKEATKLPDAPSESVMDLFSFSDKDDAA